MLQLQELKLVDYSIKLESKKRKLKREVTWTDASRREKNKSLSPHTLEKIVQGFKNAR